MAQEKHQEVPCPFCGLACDDLELQVDGSAIRLLAGACPLSRAGFENASDESTPRISNNPVSFEDALTEAAGLLQRARRPLFAGMGADVAGMRALLGLADRLGGIVDPANSDGMLRNLLTLQASGLLSTTLSEVKNRADLVVIAGTDVVTRFPRFFERHIWNRESLFGEGPPKREIVYLGNRLAIDAGVSPDGARPEVIACDPRKLGEVARVLRALVAGLPVQAEVVAGVGIDAFKDLAKRMAQARYGVLVWVAADFDFPHAELTVQSLVELVMELNRTIRFSALPLGGRNGDLTATQVATWQTGYPLRVGFGLNGPEYEPHLNRGEAVAERREVDCRMWISSFDAAATPPDSQLPTIVLGRAGMRFTTPPQVYIPVGTPGIDHEGHVFRTDNVVAVRVKKLRESALPSVAQVLHAIEKAL
jgi:formylmethanofuran dehydrogenase subunit B